MRCRTCCRRCVRWRRRGGRLAVVFGAGGDRDPSKRSADGRIAARFADRVLVTSDNPRSEDPLAIIEQMESNPGAHEVEADRARAIEKAIVESSPEDVVLIAGKGHETYQEIAGRRIHFSDRSRRAPRLRGGGDDAARRGCRRARGRTSGGDMLFTGVSTDSRSIRAGDLFVALRGERFDGHDFSKAAAAAAAAMMDAAYRGEYPLPTLVVGDTRRSLGDLARYWRARFAPTLIAITARTARPR